MILSNLLTLFKVNVSYLELFYSILKVLGFEIYLRFFFQFIRHTEFFTCHGGYLQNITL